MTRYIDADALLQRLPDDLPYKASVKRVLMQATEADVATRIEVAMEIFAEIEKHKKIIADCFQPVYTFKQKEFEELKKKYTEVEQ